MPTSTSSSEAVASEVDMLEEKANVGMQQEEASLSAPPSSKEPLNRKIWIGLVFGFAGAIFYTLANVALKMTATTGDWQYAILVTFHKSLPVTIVGWILVLRYEMRGEVGLPPKSLLPTLLGTGIIMQFGGNVLFQLALGYCGLALTVPFTFALIILTGALFGFLILKEHVSFRSLMSMLVLVTAIALLSMGTWEASKAVQTTDRTIWTVIGGVLAACFSGISYGIGGVMIRRTVKELPVATTLVCITSVGTISFGIITLLHFGWSGFVNLPWQERQIMLIAGVFNGFGFFAITKAFRTLSVIQGNLINSTQILMAAVIAILFFNEPLTQWLIIGLVLTGVGLAMMDRQKQK